MDRREALFPLFAAVSAGTALLIQLLIAGAESGPAHIAKYAFAFAVPVLGVLAMELWRMPTGTAANRAAERWFVTLLILAVISWVLGVIAFFWSHSKSIAVTFLVAGRVAAAVANHYRESLKRGWR